MNTGRNHKEIEENHRLITYTHNRKLQFNISNLYKIWKKHPKLFLKINTTH
jgi:hypothetical protein